MLVTKPLFVFSADWHIARSAWINSGIAGDSHFSLSQIIDTQLELGVPHIVGGDIFNVADPAPTDMEFVRRQFDRVRGAKLSTYFVQGNHDKWSELSIPSAIHRHPTHVHDTTFQIGDFTCYGIDHRSRSFLWSALEQIPQEAKILVLHQSCSELMGESKSGHMQCELTLGDLPPWIQLVLVGDYHRHCRIDVPRVNGPPVTVLSPGLICMQDIGEPNQKFFYVVGYDPSGAVVADSMPLKTRVFQEWKAHTEAEFDDLMASGFALLEGMAATAAKELPEVLHKPLLRVRYADDIPEASRRLTVAAKSRCHLFAAPFSGKVVDEDGVDVQAVVQRLHDSGMLGVLADMPIDDADDPEAVRRDVASLLAPGSDPAQVLEQICNAIP